MPLVSDDDDDDAVAGRSYFGGMQQESRLLCSQLQLAIMQAFLLAGKDKEDPQDEMELEPGEVMDESDTRHLVKGTDLKHLAYDIVRLIKRSKASGSNCSAVDQNIQLALDRFSQTLQVAIASGCISATKGKYQVITVVPFLLACLTL